MRTMLLKAQRAYYNGHIERHIANIEILLRNSVGIGEHQNIQTAIEEELGLIADYNDKLEMLDMYFSE